MLILLQGGTNWKSSGYLRLDKRRGVGPKEWSRLKSTNRRNFCPWASRRSSLAIVSKCPNHHASQDPRYIFKTEWVRGLSQYRVSVNGRFGDVVPQVCQRARGLPHTRQRVWTEQAQPLFHVGIVGGYFAPQREFLSKENTFVNLYIAPQTMSTVSYCTAVQIYISRQGTCFTSDS